jgi:regulator of chromosome condensation
LYVVGSGDFGQLGLGEDVATRGRPSPLALPTAAPVVAVAAGGLHSLAVTADGELYSWGVNDTYSLGREARGAPSL